MSKHKLDRVDERFLSSTCSPLLQDWCIRLVFEFIRPLWPVKGYCFFVSRCWDLALKNSKCIQLTLNEKDKVGPQPVSRHGSIRLNKFLLAPIASNSLLHLDTSANQDILSIGKHAKTIINLLPQTLISFRSSGFAASLDILMQRCPKLKEVCIDFAQGVRVNRKGLPVECNIHSIELRGCTNLKKIGCCSLLDTCKKTLRHLVIAGTRHVEITSIFRSLVDTKLELLILNQVGGGYRTLSHEDFSDIIQFFSSSSDSLTWLDITDCGFGLERSDNTLERPSLFSLSEVVELNTPVLPKLRVFSLDSCHYADNRVLHFIAKGSPLLERFSLNYSGTSIDDWGIIQLSQGCRKLKIVSLKSCHNIGEASARALEFVPSLELDGCRGVPRALRRAAYERREAFINDSNAELTEISHNTVADFLKSDAWAYDNIFVLGSEYKP